MNVACCAGRCWRTSTIGRLETGTSALQAPVDDRELYPEWIWQQISKKAFLFHFFANTRIISNISTVLYFFNVPPPRAIIGDVPSLETVPLLFQPHFRDLLPCQIHVRHTHFRVFSPVQIMNLHSVLIMETEHFIF